MPVKKPEDRRRKRAPFVFMVDGTEYELSAPSFGALEDLADAENETKGVMALIRSCATPEGVEALRSLDAQDVNDLFTDWLAEVGGGAGKSSGSSD